MSKQKSLIINIPESCNEAWNEMRPENDGRFCLSCQKKVIDFSLMSDSEILQTLSTAGKSCCGRFETTQLDRIITARVQPSVPVLPAALLVTLLGTTAPETGNARQVVNVAASVIDALDIRVPICIDGRIIDAATGDALTGVTIALKGSSIGITSDQTGYFRVNIPDACHNGAPILRISCIGYDAIEFTIDSSYTLPYTIGLNKSTNNLKEINVVSYLSYKGGHNVTGAVVCTRVYQRDNWWQRFKALFVRQPD